MKMLALALAVAAMTQEDPKPLKVLLIGNSQCPTIVKEQFLEKLAASDKGGRPLKIGACVKGGASLRSHWDAGTGEGTARAMIAAGGWDFVVLQDIYFVQEAAFQPAARQFHALVRESGSRTLLFGTASILSDYPKGFDRQHGLHLAMGKELGVPIVDASAAYFKYFGEKPSTERLESLFAKDKAHPGLWGSYLYSCMIYSALTGRSPVGLAAPDAIRRRPSRCSRKPRGRSTKKRPPRSRSSLPRRRARRRDNVGVYRAFRLIPNLIGTAIPARIFSSVSQRDVT